MPELKQIIQKHSLSIGVVSALFSVVVLGLVWFFSAQNQQSANSNAAANERYAVQSVNLPLDTLSPAELGSAQSLSINGQLNVNNSLVLAPSSRPINPVKGQLYYDGASDTISYYDGTIFTSVANTAEQSVQDRRIDQVEQAISTLQNTTPSLPADMALLGSNNTFVGANLFDGSVSTKGLYVKAGARIAETLLVGGATTLTDSLTVNGVTSLGATSISSLVLSTTLPVSSGGTGASSLTANSIVIGNGSDALGTVSAAASDLCLISTAGAPEFKPCPGGVGSGVNSLNGLYGSLSIANATAAGSTITIDNASTSAKGLAQFNASNFSVVGGVVNTVQNLSTSAAPTFSSLTVSSNLAVSGSVTIGIVCTTGQTLTTNGSGTVVCSTDDIGTDTDTTYAAGNGITISGAANTISINPQTGGGLSFTGGQLGLIGCSAGQILKYTGTAWGCAADFDTVSPGDGIGTTVVGTLDSQTKNSNGATIYDNGGTLTIALQTADASNPGLITTSAQTFSGAKVFADDLTLQGDIGQAGTGTFTTGTGAVALNGNVTIASGRSFTLGTSCAANQVLTTNGSGVLTCVTDDTGTDTDTDTTYAAGNGISISGAGNTIAVNPQVGGGLSFSTGQLGLIACTAGQILKYTGTAWGCAADSDTVSAGDGIGATAVGTLDSQSKNSNGATIYDNGGTLTIALQTADESVAGLVSTGLQTFSGAKTFTSPLTVQNNFVQSGAATFTTGTGTVSLNGNVTIASGRSLTIGAICTAGQVLSTNVSGAVICVTDDIGTDTDTDTDTTYAAGDGITISGAANTISVNPQTGGGLQFNTGQLSLLACSAGQILKYSGSAWGCATDSDTVSPGDGIGVTAVGALDGQTKNSNGATIYNNGGTLTIALQSADNLNSGLLTAGSQTIGGAKTFINDLTLQGNFGQSGSGSFSTGTGTVSLNGNVVIASSRNLTLGAACTAGQVLGTDGSGVVTCVTDDIGTDTDTDTNTTYAAGDGITISGPTNVIAVNPQTGGGLSFVSGQLGIAACSNGEILKYDSGTWGCATDSDTVSPGDGIGVTAVGALDGQTKNSNGATIYNNGGTLTIALQSADGVSAGIITAGTQTIGGAKTFTDALTVQGAFTQTGSGTFSTGSGAVALNGNVTIASGRSLTVGAACTTGQVLTTDSGGVLTCVTDDIGTDTDTDTNTTYAAGDGIAITGVSNDISVRLQTGGGLSFASGQIGLLTSCTINQVLKFDGGSWVCANDVDTDTDTGVAIASGSGTNGRVAKFNASGELEDSGLLESGTTGSYTGNFIINGQTGFTGNLLDVQLNGVSRLSVTESGSTTINGGLAVTAASGVTVGVAGSVQGSLKLATTGAGTLTIQSQPQSSNVTLSVPTITGNDTFCLQSLGNCTGSGGLGTSGSVTTGALTKFDGSGDITSSGLTESGTTLSYAGNITANVDSGFSGNIFDLQKASSTVFKVGSGGLVTTAGGISGVAATGTDATGGNLALQAGSGTGSAGSGVISFSTASQAQDPFVKDLTPTGQFYQSSTPAVSANFSQTVTAGSNQVLLVTMATGHGGVSATSVTYGGVALTKLGGVRQTFDASYTEMWYLVNPNVGSATVSISLNTSATLYARAMVLTGVNQSTPFNTACTATGAGTSITCSANTSGAGVVVSLLRSSAAYSSMGSEQVSVYGNETPPAYTSVSVKPTTTSTTSMTYTLGSSTHWGFVAAGVLLADPGVNPAGLTLVDTGTLEGGPLTERMRIASDGKVGIGTFNPQYQLDVAGDINTSTGFRVGGTAGVSLTCSGATQTLGNVTVTGGIITAASCATNNSDLAENYASTDDLSAGEIVMTSGIATSVSRATNASRDSLVGVVSTAPGLLIGTEQVPDGYPIALSGRVPVKVNNENGPIAVGDKITISSVAGVGMRATSAGMIVGTALEAFNGEEGTVEVFVNASYWAPSASETLQGTDNGFTSLNVSGEATIANLVVGTLTVTGDLTVHGELTVANIVVNGHIITASGKPTVEAQPSLDGGMVMVEGTDTIGTITITTGDTPTAGELVKLVFSETYTKAPRVILSPSNEAAADFAYYKGVVSLEDFILNAKNTPAANTTYIFDYFIAE